VRPRPIEPQAGSAKRGIQSRWCSDRFFVVDRGIEGPGGQLATEGAADVESPGSVNSEGIYRGSPLAASSYRPTLGRQLLRSGLGKPRKRAVCKTFQGLGCWSALSRERGTQAAHSAINLP
jgi:hypothetical protein